jgi:hypothetical protein
VAQLGLEIAQLLLQNVHPHQNDVFRLESSNGFNDKVELVWFSGEVVRSLEEERTSDKKRARYTVLATEHATCYVILAV